MLRENIIISQEDIDRVAQSDMMLSHRCSETSPKDYIKNEYTRNAIVKAKRLLKRLGLTV